MKGWFFPTVKGQVGAIECTLTVIADDLERMLNGWSHEARFVGTVLAKSLSDGPMTASRGRFHLFQVVRDRVETRRIRYRMKLTSREGNVYFLCGFKEVRNSQPFKAWSALSTLKFTIFDGSRGKPGGVRGCGVLKLSLGDFLLQLTTIRARNARRFVERLDAPARFMGFFAGILLSTYGRVLAPSIVATPDAPPPRAPRRRPWKQPDERIKVTTSDGVSIYLTHYPGGFNGPVMLVPGFPVAASSFDAPTVDTSLVQYLSRKDFDVWLLDYRATPAAPAAWTSFTIDDIARRDYPAAVREVLNRSGADKVQIVAHCLGSVSLFISLLDGRLDGLVHSVVSSQVATHLATARFTEAKSGLYLGDLMRLLRVRQASPGFNPRAWGDWIVDQLLKLYPTQERCNNPVCRRLLFIFHEIYRHEQLNTETHDALWQWVGVASMAALSHLSLMVRTGYVVDAEGQDVYLRYDDPARHRQQLERLKLPISFMYGARNRGFLPEATRTIYDELRQANGREWYRWQPFDEYGHLDCFIGKNAAQDIFPWIVRQLKNPPQPP